MLKLIYAYSDSHLFQLNHLLSLFKAGLYFFSVVGHRLVFACWNDWFGSFVV